MKSLADLIKITDFEFERSLFFRSLFENSKKKAGRPKGSLVRFQGIKAFAAEMRVTPLHVHMVLTGQRTSGRLTRAWHERNTI